MVDSRDPADRLGERTPRAALRFEDLRSRCGQGVVAAAALPGLLDPASLDPAAFLEAIQQRIERCHAELEDAVGLGLDQLAQVVAVARLVLEQREDEELGASLLQLAIESRRLVMLHSNISYEGICGMSTPHPPASDQARPYALLFGPICPFLFPRPVPHSACCACRSCLRGRRTRTAAGFRQPW